MLRRVKLLVVMAALAWVAGPSFAAAGAEVDKSALDKACNRLRAYDWGKNRAGLKAIDDAIVASAGDAKARKDLETRLVAIVNSDASPGAKQFACRRLSIIGTAGSVPALAALLTDEAISHMGRYALERIPGAAASEALRQALPKLSAALKVGVINSLGARQDRESIPVLIPLLKDPDTQVAGAAAAALGKIGTPEAAKALARFKAQAPESLRPDAIDAYLDAAERLLAKGKKDEAEKIYRELDSEHEPRLVRLAALRGLLAVRSAEATPRLLEALAGQDQQLRRLAVALIQETPDEATTKALASALPKLPPEGQVALLDALGTRKDAAARPAVLQALKSSAENVRVAALRALATLGNAADVPDIARTAAAAAHAESDAARSALACLPGENVNQTILATMKGADPKVRTELIKALAARGAREGAPAILKSATHSDAQVRLAALEALAVLADEEHAADLVRLLKKAKNDDERHLAEKALLAGCGRGGRKSAESIIAGLEGADTPSRCALLRALGRARGTIALDAVRSAVRDENAKVKDTAIRVLSAWPDAEAAADLFEIARTAEQMAHHVLALRGYIRLARKQDAPPEEKVRNFAQAMQATRQPDEKRRVLAALAEIHTPASLRLVTPHLSDAALADEAGAAAVRIAAEMDGGNEKTIRSAMQQVLKHTKDGRVRADAQKILSKIGPPKP